MTHTYIHTYKTPIYLINKVAFETTSSFARKLQPRLNNWIDSRIWINRMLGSEDLCFPMPCITADSCRYCQMHLNIFSPNFCLQRVLPNATQYFFTKLLFAAGFSILKLRFFNQTFLNSRYCQMQLFILSPNFCLQHLPGAYCNMYTCYDFFHQPFVYLQQLLPTARCK
jgi:hypothetical protein